MTTKFFEESPGVKSITRIAFFIAVVLGASIAIFQLLHDNKIDATIQGILWGFAGGTKIGSKFAEKVQSNGDNG